ncbi:MAG: hypothetical protein WCJ84_05430 [Candidatus Peregrinibacteria bacterium]
MIEKEEQETVRQKKGGQRKSVQSHLPISEIRDGLVVLKNGGIRAVLKTSSINFHLKSEDEQLATIDAYQGFLNSLDFPVQILIRSRKLDLDQYFELLQQRIFQEENPVIKAQTREYLEYIKKLVEYADIMEKNFFVVIPKNPKRVEAKGVFQSFWENVTPEDSLEKVKQRYSEYKSLQEDMEKRVDTVKGGLERCGLRVEQLGTQALIELYYHIYNPEVSRREKLSDLSQYSVSGK